MIGNKIEIKFNIASLHNILENLSVCTKVTLTMYDTNFNIVTYSSNSILFCDFFRSSYKNFDKKCIDTDIEHLNVIKNNSQTNIYTCHAGLCETISPIKYENLIIGYLMIGRFLLKSNKSRQEKQMKAIINEYNEKDNFPYNKIKQVPVLSLKEINSIISIIETCFKNLTNEDIIRINREIIALKIEDYISNNLSEKITVDLICKEFFISKYYLYKIMEENFGTPLIDYLNSKRIEKAKKMLIDSNESISNISSLVGFSDYNYFIRIFKKETNETPNKYRSKIKKNLN